MTYVGIYNIHGKNKEILSTDSQILFSGASPYVTATDVPSLIMILSNMQTFSDKYFLLAKMTSVSCKQTVIAIAVVLHLFWLNLD